MRIPILLHCKFSESCLLRLCKKKFGFDGYSKWGIFGIVVTWHFLAFIHNTFLKCPCRNTCKTTCTPTCNSILWKVIVSKTFPIVCVKKVSFRSYKILKQAVSPAQILNVPDLELYWCVITKQLFINSSHGIHMKHSIATHWKELAVAPTQQNLEQWVTTTNHETICILKPFSSPHFFAAWPPSSSSVWKFDLGSYKQPHLAPKLYVSEAIS